jgi:hypothetical protein
MYQNIKTKSNYLFIFILGISFGVLIGNYTKPETKTETVQVDYNSVCLRTLKAYYLEQDQENKKKMIKTAGKQIALDRMMSN